MTPGDDDPAAFYLPEGGGRFRSTALTRGPWSHETQHAGPPVALLGRAIGAVEGGEDRRVVRITTEILRPVPIATLTVAAEVVRPGRRVDMVAATLRHDDQVLCRANAWRIRVGGDAVEPVADREPPMPGPATATVEPFFDTGADVGYHTAMDVRFVEGSFRTPGPARAWLRMRYPLVADEQPTSLERALIAADTGNGLSAELDPQHHLFINIDLTVALLRHPRGEWVGLDARTAIEPDGVGLAVSHLHDEDGPIGRGMQSLLVAPA